MDAISEARLADVHPELGKRVRSMITALEVEGILLRVTEGLRPWSRQADYYAKGRTVMSDIPCVHAHAQRAPGTCAEHPLGATVTNAQPGHSWHQFGLAVDVVPDDQSVGGFQADWNTDHPVWKKVIAVGEAAGLESGSEWRTRPDWPHFQLTSIPISPTDLTRQTFQQAGMQETWKELGLAA